MLQLTNTTPFQAAMAVFPDVRGVDTLYLVIKASFSIATDGALSIAEAQTPVTLADEYWDESAASSLKRAGELHLAKPGTDVVMIGHAYAPEGRTVEQLDVSLSLGACAKTVRVFGERTWKKGLFSCAPSAPVPFTTMPLRYERAFGGIHHVDSEPSLTLAEERNPVGVGFRGKRKAKEMASQPLPNLEDPAQLLRSAGDQPTPAGFGFIAPAWMPRRGYAGTYDEAWQKNRAPFLPDDFDARFFHAASADLALPGFLIGGEPLVVINACRDGAIRTALPSCTFALGARLAGCDHALSPQLETVLIEPDERRLCLSWRAAIACDKQVVRVEEIRVALRDMALAPP